MKRSPREDRIAANLQPGALCRDGFIGDDRRELAEIIAADDAAVLAMGLTHEQLVAALGEILRAATAACGNPVAIGDSGHLQAACNDAMGRIGCPWGDGHIFPKGHVNLTDTRTGRTLTFTPLSLHLIRTHGFYQGRGAPYRIDPAQIAQLLGLL